MPEYNDLGRLEKEIDGLLRRYRDAVDRVLDLVSEWNWNDPVSLMYAELFAGDVVYDPVFDQGDLAQDLAYRQIHKIPPGYKDSAKEDNSVGDLLIWRTIIEVSKSRSKNVLFVSHDKKSDWWHRSEGKALYPRYELVDEFRRLSGGGTFHVAELSRLLALYGASDEAVSEVKREEVRREEMHGQLALLPSGQQTGDVPLEVQEAALDWLRLQHGDDVVMPPDDYAYDACLVFDDEVKWVLVMYLPGMFDTTLIRGAVLRRVDEFHSKKPGDELVLIVVAKGRTAARRAINAVAALAGNWAGRRFTCVVGHMSSDGKFVVD
ncbi:PIN-like domain-containing protein [Sorangium sp. So ce118]